MANQKCPICGEPAWLDPPIPVKINYCETHTRYIASGFSVLVEVERTDANEEMWHAPNVDREVTSIKPSVLNFSGRQLWVTREALVRLIDTATEDTAVVIVPTGSLDYMCNVDNMRMN